MRLRIIAAVLTCLLFCSGPVRALSTPDWTSYRKASALLDNIDVTADGDRLAEEIMARVLSQSPNSAPALTFRGRMTARRGCPDEGPCDPRELKKAVALFEQAVSSDKNFFDAYLFQAEARMLAGEYKRAAGLLAKAGKIEPDSTRLGLLAAEMARRQNRPSEAEQLVRKVLLKTKKPTEATKARLLLAAVHRAQGKTDQAEQEYLALLETTPASVRALLAYAAFLIEDHKDFDAAVEAARRATPLDPSVKSRLVLARAYAGKAEQLLREENQPSQAQKYFNLALKEGDASPATYLGLGMSLAAQGTAALDSEKLAEGEDMIIKSLRLDPTLPGAREWLGEAEKVRRSIQGGFAPSDLTLENRRTLIVSALKKMARAQEMYRQEHGRFAGTPELLTGLADIDRDEGLSISPELTLAGYYFVGLTPPEPASPSGSTGYLFGALPARRPQEGRETYLLDQDGVIRVKDLGPDPKREALAGDDSWEKID
ncbi:MAG: tetratricopeptide repeat protein [Pseudomonadota bacterium]